MAVPLNQRWLPSMARLALNMTQATGCPLKMASEHASLVGRARELPRLATLRKPRCLCTSPLVQTQARGLQWPWAQLSGKHWQRGLSQLRRRRNELEGCGQSRK